MSQNILTDVPPELKKLVRLVARTFYKPEHFLVVDILAKHPCVTEDDLLQLLRFELKKLRFILAFLKKDKLIKNIQRIESVESATSGDNNTKKSITVQYYYINYKVFVNVVKYKLHRIREKIRSDERKSRNRTMYTCPNCQNSFTDLDVDRLMDPVDQGLLKCIMCRSELKEDVPEGNVIDAKLLLSNLNDQLQPILTLLKETENINLSPDLLDPEPHGIDKHVLAASKRHGGQHQGSKGTDQWITSKADDIYGDQTISVNFDGEEKAAKGKAIPQWMAESTVYTTGNKVGGDTTVSMETNTKSTISDGEIVALLINENKKPSGGPTPPTHANADNESSSSSSSDEDSSSEGDEMAEGESRYQSQYGSTAGSIRDYHSPYKGHGNDDDEDDDEFESDEDDATIKVGNKVYQINDITPEIVEKMNAEEKQKYTDICQKAYSNYY